MRVVVDPEGIHADNLATFLDGLDLVVEECDSLDVKFMVREEARERRIPVIMETSDRGVLDVERFDLEPTVRSSTASWVTWTSRRWPSCPWSRNRRTYCGCSGLVTCRREARRR